MRRHSWLLLLLLPLAAATAGGPPAVKVEDEPFHRLVLESPQARVFLVELPAGKTTLQHRHDHDYVQVTVGEADVQAARGEFALIDVHLNLGDARFIHGPIEHRFRNAEGFSSFRNYTVEILKKGSQPYSYPQTEASVYDYDVLPWPIEANKTYITSLDRDTVRMLRCQIRPGENLPPRASAGPALLIALTDVQLDEKVSDEQTEGRSYSAGDAQWFSGAGHQLTNTGKEPAQFIVLEFK
jgi:quercetin dioxygenase-like cupin family protein